MRKSFFSFDNKKTSKAIYDNLPTKEKELIDEFKEYIQVSASLSRAEAGETEVLRFREITGKSLFKIEIGDLRYFLKELRVSNFGGHTKNKIKDFIQRFLRWKYKDWSIRFEEFSDIKFNASATRKKPITSKDVLTEQQIMQLLNAEPSLYWKTFLITQAEAGLRTIECRNLRWGSVVFEDDGFTTLNIPSKKNRHGEIKVKPVVVKIAGNFLKKLKEQQQKYEIKTPYVFPSPYNPNKPISKGVNLWFNKLCKKTLGHSSFNYILRHSKGSHLQEKVRAGTLSKDNALEFMRHSEKMFDKVYSHMDEDAIKALIKKQIYNTKSLTKEEKNELEKVKKELETLKKLIIDYKKNFNKNLEKWFDENFDENAFLPKSKK
jgi:integrase